MSMNQALEILHRRLSRRWSEVPASAEGLSLNEFQFLRAVETVKGQCQAGPKGGSARSPHLTDLARELGLKRPSISAMAHKLEQRGLVTRIACRSDTRAQHALLTESGSAEPEAKRRTLCPLGTHPGQARERTRGQDLAETSRKGLRRRVKRSAAPRSVCS